MMASEYVETCRSINNNNIVNKLAVFLISFTVPLHKCRIVYPSARPYLRIKNRHKHVTLYIQEVHLSHPKLVWSNT